MKAWQLGLSLSIVVALFAFAVYPTPYFHGADQTEAYRVNRFTGVKEYATSSGWSTGAHNPYPSAKDALKLLDFQTREGIVASYELKPDALWIRYKDGTVGCAVSVMDAEPVLDFLRRRDVPAFNPDVLTAK